MHRLLFLLHPLTTRGLLVRALTYPLILASTGGTWGYQVRIRDDSKRYERTQFEQVVRMNALGAVSAKARQLRSQASTYQGEGLDINQTTGDLVTTFQYIGEGKYAEADRLVDLTTVQVTAAYTDKQAADAAAQAAAEEAVRRAEEDRLAAEAAAKAAAEAAAAARAAEAAKATPTPTVKATAKATATPAPPSVLSNAYSSYQNTTIVTNRGSFGASILTVDLGSGHVRAVADVAADYDCVNNCPVKPLRDYVAQHAAFAGINGTYFCPASYATCAGKTNSFYWKLYSPRLNRMVNADNLLGEQDPFLTFQSDGTPTLRQVWAGWAASPIYSGISCRPLLIWGGKNVLDESTIDDKQRTAKVARGALALKGKTLYAMNVRGATVPDLAVVLEALGVDSAMNIDGGGSSAIYYGGQYQVGPGRSLPNALVFVEY